MKALILAAGYATRLYPLTLNKPKSLLPIGEKPLIEYIINEINTIKEIDHIYVVSNAKYYDVFSEWNEGFNSSTPISIANDGTIDNETRLGAIGDINFIIEKYNIDDELMIVAGDTFFDFKLLDYYNFYKEKSSDTVLIKKILDPEILKQVGVGILDKNNKLLSIEEKSPTPKSNDAVIAFYFFLKDTVKLVKTYLDKGNKPDAPGYFIEWLVNIHTIYGFHVEGACHDIGTIESYNEVCKLYKN